MRGAFIIVSEVTEMAKQCCATLISANIARASDIYAVSSAKILFKQNIPGEFWLQDLLDAASNTDLHQVIISGAYNTPQGARNYIQWVGGNLSEILDIDLDAKTSTM